MYGLSAAPHTPHRQMALSLCKPSLTFLASSSMVLSIAPMSRCQSLSLSVASPTVTPSLAASSRATCCIRSPSGSASLSILAPSSVLRPMLSSTSCKLASVGSPWAPRNRTCPGDCGRACSAVQTCPWRPCSASWATTAPSPSPSVPSASPCARAAAAVARVTRAGRAGACCACASAAGSRVALASADPLGGTSFLVSRRLSSAFSRSRTSTRPPCPPVRVATSWNVRLLHVSTSLPFAKLGASTRRRVSERTAAAPSGGRSRARPWFCLSLVSNMSQAVSGEISRKCSFSEKRERSPWLTLSMASTSASYPARMTTIFPLRSSEVRHLTISSTTSDM
mmetsp:Transcript_18829/g.47495  ORF Transcript_18829/g.47495 Transcript_18829/m.47495 type:complete len:338 (-) Transcript_18829:6615-7628(-)